MPTSVASQSVATPIFPGFPCAQGAVCLSWSSRTHNLDLLPLDRNRWGEAGQSGAAVGTSGTGETQWVKETNRGSLGRGPKGSCSPSLLVGPSCGGHLGKCPSAYSSHHWILRLPTQSQQLSLKPPTHLPPPRAQMVPERTGLSQVWPSHPSQPYSQSSLLCSPFPCKAHLLSSLGSFILGEVCCRCSPGNVYELSQP